MRNIKTMRSADEERRYSQTGGKNRWFSTMVLPVIIEV